MWNWIETGANCVTSVYWKSESVRALSPLIAAAAAPWECAIRCQSVHRLGRSSSRNSRCDPQVEWQKRVRCAALAFGHYILCTRRSFIIQKAGGSVSLFFSHEIYKRLIQEHVVLGSRKSSLALASAKRALLLFYCRPRGRKNGSGLAINGREHKSRV